jgi:3-oxoacyl-[acyl-carrier protein] reductase
MARTMFDLTARTALVTGAGQNVGAGIAAAFAARGARVAVNDIRPDRAAAAAEQIVAAGGDAVAVPFVVVDAAAVAEAVASLGGVDILVNNAGGGEEYPTVPQQFKASDPASWDAPVRVNLFGVMHCSRAVIEGMCERGWGRIITISSAAGTAGVNVGVSAYAAGKGGGIAFTRTLALEVARHGVTANTVALGVMAASDPTVAERLAKTIPVGRVGTPEDVAAACVWLASDEAGWVTAQTIQVNGGAVTT